MHKHIFFSNLILPHKNKLFKTYLYLIKPEKHVHLLILLTVNNLDLEVSEA